MTSDNRIWSSVRLWSYAGLLSGLYLLAWLLGFEENASILAGANSGGYFAHFTGIAYLLLYICFTGVVPILLIAGSLLWAMGRWVVPAVAAKPE